MLIADDFKIKAKVSHFEARFKGLAAGTLKELLKGSKISLEDLQLDLTLLPSDIKSDHVAFIEKNIKKLTEASGVKEVLLLLNTYWDHNNYTLLKMLVDMYGSRELQQKMTCYVSDLHQFWRETKVADFINFCKKNDYKFKRWPAAQTPLDFAELKCVINKPVTLCTLFEVEHLRCQFSQGLHLQDFALILFEMGESSLVIKWLMDVSLKEHIKIILESKEGKFLEEIDVKKILINGELTYPVSMYACRGEDSRSK